MDDVPAAPPTGPSGRAPVRPGARRRRQVWWIWPVLVPLLAIPAFIAAILVSGLVSGLLPSPDFCGQPFGPTCQQEDAQISAIRLAACGGAALALALWLAAFLPPARRGPLSQRVLLVLTGHTAMLSAALIVLRVGL